MTEADRQSKRWDDEPAMTRNLTSINEYAIIDSVTQHRTPKTFLSHSASWAKERKITGCFSYSKHWLNSVSVKRQYSSTVQLLPFLVDARLFDSPTLRLLYPTETSSLCLRARCFRLPSQLIWPAGSCLPE